MRTRTGDEYILLEDSAAVAGLPPAQQQQLELALVVAVTMPSLWAAPAPEFVAELERDLLLAAQRRRRALYLLGAAGGGVLSLVGGALVWYLWRRQQEPSSAPRRPALAFRGAGMARRQPA